MPKFKNLIEDSQNLISHLFVICSSEDNCSLKEFGSEFGELKENINEILSLFTEIIKVIKESKV